MTPGSGLTPRLMTDGTQMTLTGNGFCPGTQVQVGGTGAIADANVVDPHTITFHMPTLATTGPVTVVPRQGDVAYLTDNSVQVDSFRNTDGFQFHNFDFDGLSLGELTDAFGADALFIRVNPCGFLGDCSFNTGILNPLVAIEWPIISKALSSTNGHCFGISRAVQEFLSGHRSLRSFTTAGAAFAIPSADHPQTAVGHFLDAEHALQASAEFLNAWFDRDKSVSGQLARAKAALAHGDFPIVTLRHGALTGHALVAYNAVDNPDGTSDIYVYDSNREFRPGEDASADFHRSQVQDSVVHMDPIHGKWSYQMVDGTTWTGGGGGTLFVAPDSVIPQHPSLPGISTVTGGLEYLVFGSADGSVTTTGPAGGAEYLPVLDSHAIPGGRRHVRPPRRRDDKPARRSQERPVQRRALPAVASSPRSTTWPLPQASTTRSAGAGTRSRSTAGCRARSRSSSPSERGIPAAPPGPPSWRPTPTAAARRRRR